MTKKEQTKQKPQESKEVCAHCGKTFIMSQYEGWCIIIMKHKPACSYECNKELGQVK